MGKKWNFNTYWSLNTIAKTLFINTLYRSKCDIINRCVIFVPTNNYWQSIIMAQNEQLTKFTIFLLTNIKFDVIIECDRLWVHEGHLAKRFRKEFLAFSFYLIAWKFKHMEICIKIWLDSYTYTYSYIYWVICETTYLQVVTTSFRFNMATTVLFVVKNHVDTTD